MASNFFRDNFHSTILGSDGKTLVTNVVDFDFNDFNDFISNKTAKKHTVTDMTAGAADYISYLEYGSHSYWWLICMVNNILDPITELVSGLDLAIPKIEDIENYYNSKKSAKIRRTSVVIS